MRLLVTENMTDDVSLGVMQITPTQLNDVKTHLFIISHDFDTVVVELTDKLQLGVLKKLVTRTKVIPIVGNNPSSHIISLICELYPEESAKLRYQFMRDRAGIDMVVDEIRKANCWEEFY